MNKLIDAFFYFIWRILNTISFIRFIFSSSKKISRKESYLGQREDLAILAKKINTGLFKSSEFLRKVESAKVSTDNFGFTFDCYDYLSKDLKNEIYEFARSNQFLNREVDSFLGINSTLNTISIYANVPRESDVEIGSKMWHRDGNTYLAADFMFAVSEINDNNGPFYWVAPCDFGDAKFYKSKSDNGWEDSGRFSDDNLFDSGLKQDSIQKFVGLPGSYILLNTGESFHKGGFCKSEVRILGRFVYSSFGYSIGNVNRYNSNCLKKGLMFSILYKLYSLHEKIYRNVNKLVTK